jgi:phenylalanyl-tRNA synthetase beta chain
VFIECTATDLNKAKIVLNTVVTMFSEYSANKFAVEPVDVVSSSGDERAYPDFMTRFVDVDPDYVRKRIGVTAADIDTKAMAALLCRMQLPTKIDGDVLRVEVPPTRSDILHPCDVAEDVAIAYGYNNINKEKAGPNVVTVGAQQPLNNFSDLVRQEMASQGFSEVLTWILCSHDDNFANVNREDDGDCAAIVANPSSLDVQVARSSLLQGVLKAMGANKDAPVPAKLFEVGDVVLLDASKDVGARNSRRLLVLYSNTTSGFEVAHGALDRVMQITGAAKDGDAGYTLDTSMNEATYFPGRQAGIVRDGKRIGVMGVVHPTVLGKFDIVNPCSVLELDLEPFVDIGM